MDIDKILEDLAKLGIYVNKDKVYAMKYTMYDDGTELYMVFFDNYKIYVKKPPNKSPKTYTYPIYEERKTRKTPQNQ